MQSSFFDPNKLVNNQVISEDYTDENKTKEFLYSIENCDDFFETLQGKLRDFENTEETNVSIVFEDLPECQTVVKKVMF